MVLRKLGELVWTRFCWDIFLNRLRHRMPNFPASWLTIFSVHIHHTVQALISFHSTYRGDATMAYLVSYQVEIHFCKFIFVHIVYDILRHYGITVFSVVKTFFFACLFSVFFHFSPFYTLSLRVLFYFSVIANFHLIFAGTVLALFD